MTTTAVQDASRAKYPTRDSHHAHRVARLLAKSCAAQEIGPEACWLISIIAHQEDAKRYTGAVTFYNEQLMPLCGFGSKGSLTRARDRCIEAGWLYYECGGKRKPGRYWTLIPGHANGLPDTPTDESETVSRSICRTEIDQEAGAKRAQSEPRSGRKVNQEADGKRTPFYPSPFPSPFPIPEEESLSPDGDGTGVVEAGDEEAGAKSDESPPGELLDLIRWWNSLRGDGLVPHGVSESTPSKGVLAGWRRVQRSKTLRQQLSRRRDIAREICESQMLQRGTWFRLEKLLGGTNKDGEYILTKLLDGAYRDGANWRDSQAKPTGHDAIDRFLEAT